MTTARILVVEDERIIARGIEKRLKVLGYTLAGLVASGEEAIQFAVDSQPDLILMDINLGVGIDGVEAADRIRKRLDVPVVFLTAFSDDATIQRAKVTEPFGYILKPFDDKDLQTAIEIGLHKHKAERLLRENEQWLAATLGSIGDGVIASDESGRVRFMNPLAETLTGWSRAEALGRELRDVFQTVDERSRQPQENPALAALRLGVPSELTSGTILVGKDGTERPIDDSAAPIRGSSGKLSGAVLVFRDVTERRKLEEHARQAQKMEAIGRLAGGIAHDFNNIMTIITGFSDMLVADPSLTKDQRESLHHIQQAGKRAASLTQQIVAFSRKQMLVASVLNLNSIVRDVGMMVKRLLGPNVEFAVDAARDLGSVKADPTQIGQVILNLAANARDAMPNGGRFAIATANVEISAEVAERTPDLKPGRYALTTVTDTGCGMSEEVQRHIFEPFFTTKELGQGSGLGLSAAYGIVKQSDGHIEVASELGRGTTFRIYLPLVEEVQPRSSNRDKVLTAKGDETILLVEDEDTVRRMLKKVLEREGYRILEAADGLEALAIAERHDAPIDLMVTDLSVPQLSGREIAERLAKAGRIQRVLYVSGYADESAGQRGIEMGSSNFLYKPFNLSLMIAKVREILDRPKSSV
jgi:PAS domain S-box-containing protein